MTQETNDPAKEQRSEEPQQLTEEQIENMSYEDFLKLTNPGKSDAEVKKMLRKERRYTWIGRVQILLLVLIILVVIYFIITK